jgi:hypothetical protein
LTIGGAWYVNQLIARLPFDMPYAVDVFLRGVVRLIGYSELANPDDMEVLAGALYFVISLVLVGTLVWLGNWLVRKRVARNSAAGAKG